ncbi:hypothetical protein [Pseudomonas leptonychotis]|uniref:hypothetical protein n=1 Tax=Pseudomonas leptonychotis TaxID=2448482 RepID=UPI0039F0452F
MSLQKILLSFFLIFYSTLALSWNDLEPSNYQAFHQQNCKGSDILKTTFPNFSDGERRTIEFMTENLFWYDFALYLTSEPETRTERIVTNLKSENIPISSTLIKLKQSMGDLKKTQQIIIYTQEQEKPIQDSHDTFYSLAKADPQLALAIDTVLICKTVSNIINLQPITLKRLELVSKITVPTSSQPPNYQQDHCSCSGHNVCFGPRGGRYCITRGGNKRYGV